MPAAKRGPAHSSFECCMFHPLHPACSGRQMRNGFFVLNILAWILAILTIRLLV
jgi:hypothetical protein